MTDAGAFGLRLCPIHGAHMAKKDSAKPDQDTPEEKPAEVLMEKDGVQTEVANNDSVQAMEAAGWKLVA
jgi:hypothetical protein